MKNYYYPCKINHELLIILKKKKIIIYQTHIALLCAGNGELCSGLSGRSQFPTQEYVRRYSQNDKDDDERNDVQHKTGIGHVQFGECGVGWTEMAVCLMALELFAAVRVGGKSGALETVTDVRQVGDPAQVDGNSVERYEEAGEQQEWNRHDGGQEDTVLNVHGRTDHQTDTLRNEWY